MAPELRAINDSLDLGYSISFWRTRAGQEVDFVLYGERGLVAIEVKRSAHYHERDLAGLRLFVGDYPMARCLLFYGGDREYEVDRIRVTPLARALQSLPAILEGSDVVGNVGD